jgi:hypothetical protein
MELRARGESEATQFDEIEDELYPSLDGVKTFVYQRMIEIECCY